MNTWPKTRKGLVDLIVEQLSKAETTYVPFCKEMESAQNDRSPEAGRLFESFCNKSCGIHGLQQLLCLPLMSGIKFEKESGAE